MTSNARSWVTSAFSSILLIAFAVTASAQSQTRSFNVPVQAATTGIPEFARQAGIQILVAEKLVRGKQTAAVVGSLTVDRALAMLLQGTGLTASSKDGVTFTLSLLPSTAARGTAVDGALFEAGGNATASSLSSSEPEKTGGLDEIIVTGTNISGVDNKTVPLISFDRAAIDRTGYSSLADFITALPQNYKGGNTPDGVLSGTGIGINNVENSTAANLRGLGSSSTLTLLNGHRIAPSAFGTGVDLSVIPLEAVERVDVVTDGSSAVYGSDAVGGVINIILRKDFNGQSTTARLDTLGRGGGELKQFGQTVGRTWETGGALAVLQFDDANKIRSDQRTFTANIPQPNDIYPSSKRYSGVLSAHQSIGSSLEVFGDALLGHNSLERNFTLDFGGPDVQLIDSRSDSTSVNLGARWQPFGDWHLEGNSLYSQVDSRVTEIFTPELSGYTNGAPFVRMLATIKEGDLKLDGTLWSAGGSSLKAAFGGSYREEAFSSLAIYTGTDSATSRHVHAFFAEFYAPLITAANALPGVQKLELSAAVRDDDYSDFGTKINPRFGIFWSPIQQVGLRAAFSTSFRAPNPDEALDVAANTFAYVEPGLAQPGDPAGNTPVLLFGNQTLKPESSRNLTVGLDFTPTSLPTTRFSLNYYRIIYSDRIITSPFGNNVFDNPQVYGPLIRQFPNDAAVAAFVASLEPPQTVFDFTPAQTGLAGIRYGFPYGDINAAKERTQGVDLSSHSLVNLDEVNKLIFDFTATYIKEISNTYCDTCASIDVADTYANPLKLRLRAATGWSNGAFSVNGAVNFANAYSDTNLVPAGRIDSYTTADLNASWRYARTGTTLSFNIINLFNENPPLTFPSYQKVQYDPTNADARGRILSLQVRQSW